MIFDVLPVILHMETTACPYCAAPLATAKAQQCFACGWDWHDAQNPVRRGDPDDDDPGAAVPSAPRVPPLCTAEEVDIIRRLLLPPTRGLGFGTKMLVLTFKSGADEAGQASVAAKSTHSRDSGAADDSGESDEADSDEDESDDGIQFWDADDDDEKAEMRRFCDVALFRTWVKKAELRALLLTPGPRLIRENDFGDYRFFKTVDHTVLFGPGWEENDTMTDLPEEAVRVTTDEAFELITALQKRIPPQDQVYYEPVSPEQALHDFRFDRIVDADEPTRTKPGCRASRICVRLVGSGEDVFVDEAIRSLEVAFSHLRIDYARGAAEYRKEWDHFLSADPPEYMRGHFSLEKCKTVWVEVGDGTVENKVGFFLWNDRYVDIDFQNRIEYLQRRAFVRKVAATLGFRVVDGSIPFDRGESHPN